MKRFIVLLGVLVTLPLSAQRITENLNFGWDFRLNDEGEW